MKLRPTIFLSGVSSEFGSFRDAVEVEVEKKGCFPLNQPSFPPDYRTVEEMLRRRLSEADAVIHIAGFRFGAEPNQRPADKPRRSYTQMEFDIAREMRKPIYVFLSAQASVRDAPDEDEKPEDADVAALQSAHRERIRNGDHLYDFFKDKAELCQKVAQIPIVASTDSRVDISRIDKYAPAELIGREADLKLLNDAWQKVRRAESQRPHIITFVALGGEGKTSLVAKWLAELAHNGWPGCDAAFAWSFYSQGTRDQVASSSDLFLKEAITFFGDESDKEFAASAAGAYEKGQRLARIVGQRRSLVILDGLEPLQYAPTSPTRGELKDSGIAALLKGLASRSNGLCIVTTRYSLPNLKAFWQTTAPEVKLIRLSLQAGVHLLKMLGVNGTTREFETLVEDVKGHALTLNLLGTYLRDAHGGDIRRRDLVELEKADAEEQGGHAFRVMEAYERAFEYQGEKGLRALAILRLLGLFDRPASADCLAALLKEPAIQGLTESLVVLNEAQRNVAFKRLEDAELLTVTRERSGTLVSLDAHPLLREYFARQLETQRSQPWRAGHLRVYKHLSESTLDKAKPTLEELQPLYQAIAHGCHAGLHQEACIGVYYKRILREAEHYTWQQLGAYGSELGAQACFFETPWTRLSTQLSEGTKSWMFYQTAFTLRALGRLTEALEPARVAGRLNADAAEWESAAIVFGNLSELELTLGQVATAVEDAEKSVGYAERDGKPAQRMVRLTTHANALYQAGYENPAQKLFREAEQMQKELQPELPLLYSVRGFQYCQLLLAAVERDAWNRTLDGNDKPQHSKELQTIYERAERTLKWTESGGPLLTIALHHLTLGFTALYEAVLSTTHFLPKSDEIRVAHAIDIAVNRLRNAGAQDYLPHGLLTRAWLRYLTNYRIGSDSAQEDLDEAWEIAERGPMRLYMADIHLYRARLFFREDEYPWGSARGDLEAAEKLINECGYHRRDEELSDAKRVILGQSA